jgi:ribosomal protein S18 acetylase RimI-like enzyme
MCDIACEFRTKDGRTVRLRQAVEDDATDFIRAVDSVARERAYFVRSRFEVDEERERAFITESAERGDLIVLAVVHGRPALGEPQELAGWLTLFRARPEFLRHTGELGMGVVRGYRGLGIGSALMVYALEWAAQKGLEKVKLGVRASNERARALYLQFGFAEEGRRLREIKDPLGRYDDSIEMAVFMPHLPPTPEGDAEGGSGA